MNLEDRFLGLFDFEKQRAARKISKVFTLERVSRALDMLGRPDKALKIIHVAGTKGKGSVCHFIAKELESKNLGPVGLFTSPHLLRLNERVRINARELEDEELSDILDKLHQLNQESFKGELSFFEMLTLMALEAFKKAGVSWAVLETGLGGRLDATNVVTPKISVLTRIGLDHCDILGYSLEEIAAEKAGILKAGIRALALFQSEEVNNVFSQRAKELGLKLNWVHVPDDAPVAYENACVARGVLELLDPKQAWSEVALLSQWPIAGRMERHELKEGGLLILDAAHNPLALTQLIKALKKEGKPFHVCMSLCRDKDWQASLEPIVNEAKSLSFIPLPGGRLGVEPSLMLKRAKELNPDLQLKELKVGDWKTWLCSDLQGTKVITGSFYLVGEVLRELKKAGLIGS